MYDCLQGGSGYSLNVLNVIQNATNGSLSTVQHGGGFGGGGQAASSAGWAQKLPCYLGL